MSGIDKVKLVTKGWGLNFKIKKVEVEYKPFSLSEIKQCFTNAYRYVSRNPDATYVLGYYLMFGTIPIEHVFVKQNGKYLDVTIDSDDERDEYYSVVELSDQEMHKLAANNGTTPDLYQYARSKR